MKEKREYVKYRLAIIGEDLQSLADALGLHRNSIYLKLEGKIPVSEKEIKVIKDFLKLTDKENENLWGIK